MQFLSKPSESIQQLKRKLINSFEIYTVTFQFHEESFTTLLVSQIVFPLSLKHLRQASIAKGAVHKYRDQFRPGALGPEMVRHQKIIHSSNLKHSRIFHQKSIFEHSKDINIKKTRLLQFGNFNRLQNSQIWVDGGWFSKIDLNH